MYLRGARGRFEENPKPSNGKSRNSEKAVYNVPRPGLLWDDLEEEPLPKDGGRARPSK